MKLLPILALVVSLSSLAADAPSPALVKDGQREARLRDYLHRTYPCQVLQVSVGEREITIEGSVGPERSSLFLAEVPIYADVTELKQLPLVVLLKAGSDGRFSVTLERPNKTEGDDLLLGRWAVVRKTGTGYELLSHAHYADAVQARFALPEAKPRNKKGLGGFGLDRPVSDLDDLDIAAVTVNVVLNSLMAADPAPGRTPFRYAGRTWYVRDGAVASFDRTFLEAAKHHLVVSAIILVNQPGADAWGRLAACPDADRSGIFVMPNMSSKEGVEAYAAALDFLAERYSRPDGQFGRIHHWILHNEVNAGWVWTNAGEKSSLLYMDLYERSMRLAHLIARQYDPRARAFISLEQHWTARMDSHCYAGRELLDLLLEQCQAEGDFEWALAFHPYPQDLFEPRVWADTEAKFALSTPKITFKNLEVLDAWAHQPRTFFQGKTPRVIHLTEQGLNSRAYSEKALLDQAAGMAYAWNKFQSLSSIEVFDYHNWVDNRGEGGLRIGLRKFPDEPGDPLGRKPIWQVYQALGTAKQEEATAFAKPIIGIKEWSEVPYRGAIGEN